MTLDDILESSVSIVKTVWQKRGDKVTRKEVSRIVATGADKPRPRKDIKVTRNDE